MKLFIIIIVISLTFELIVNFIIRLLMLDYGVFFEFSLSSCFREVRRPGVIQGLSGELILFILIRKRLWKKFTDCPIFHKNCRLPVLVSN